MLNTAKQRQDKIKESEVSLSMQTVVNKKESRNILDIYVTVEVEIV